MIVLRGESVSDSLSDRPGAATGGNGTSCVRVCAAAEVPSRMCGTGDTHALREGVCVHYLRITSITVATPPHHFKFCNYPRIMANDHDGLASI